MQTKNKQGKFVSVLKGSILDVVLRKNSKTFGKHFKIELRQKWFINFYSTWICSRIFSKKRKYCSLL